MILPHISYHKVLDQIKDGIFITDIKQKIVYWNFGAAELTGYKSSEIVGRFCYDIGALCKKDHRGHTLCSPEACPLAKALIENKSGIYPHLVFMMTKRKEELPVSINVGPIHDIEGKIVGGICVFRDMRDEYRQRRLAGEIQRKMVTLGKIRKNGVFIETIYKPVEEIGGDFLEAFFLDDKSLVITVADATGHGISASLFTVIYKTLLHSSFAFLHNPVEVLRNVNHGFLKTSQIDGYYITAAMVIYNPVTRTGKYASAGHPPALIFRKTDAGYQLKQELCIRSLMIGVEDNVQFSEIDFQLDNDEFLFLFSDGLYEAECKGGQFGTEGIKRFFSSYSGYDLLNDLLLHLNEQSIYVELIDDVSMIKLEPSLNF